MVNLSQFCTQALDKITQLRLYFTFQTATKHSWLEDQMAFWLFTKNLTQRKPKTFIWEVTGNSTSLNIKEKLQVYLPHRSKTSLWLVWALEWFSKCHWTKMKSQGANMQSNHSTLTVSQVLIFVWENLWSPHVRQTEQSGFGIILKKILWRLSSSSSKNLWAYLSILQDFTWLCHFRIRWG